MDLTLQAKTKLMGLFSNDIVTFDDLFLHQLQDVSYAENQITKALPKMIDKATAPALRAGFETHLRETEGQIARLERIFDLLGEKAKAVTCPAIDGIIKEANEVAGEIENKAVLDAALIASAQAVEHYEITRYGTLIAWAEQLERPEIVSILQETLDEEYAIDDKLTVMAKSSVNPKAEAVVEA
jgi:ferritin-like metal-binding protein YciE